MTWAHWSKALSFFGWIFVACATLLVLSLVIVFGSLLVVALGGNELADQSVKTDRAVGVVELTGEILNSSKFTEKLRKAVENEKLKAIVVLIDSPGGAVGASEEIYRQITIADKKKPVTCALSNLAASGGLPAVGCRKIVTNAGTLTGSIGVVMMIPNVSELTDKYGFHMNVVKSGQFKDSGSPFRTFDPSDRELLQRLVNQTYEQFVAVIATARKLNVDDVKKFADGRIILGEQAVQLGLADELGGVDRAAKLALEAAGNDGEPEIIYPQKPGGLMGVFEDVSEARIWNWIQTMGKVRLLYQMVE